MLIGLADSPPQQQRAGGGDGDGDEVCVREGSMGQVPRRRSHGPDAAGADGGAPCFLGLYRRIPQAKLRTDAVDW
jgi:hypothetical protein